jgi:hypothetical protein
LTLQFSAPGPSAPYIRLFRQRVELLLSMRRPTRRSVGRPLRCRHLASEIQSGDGIELSHFHQSDIEVANTFGYRRKALLHASGGLLRSRAVFSNVSRAAFAVLSSKFLFSLIGSSPDVSVDPNGRPVQVADGLCQGNDALDLCELGASRLVRGGTGGFSRPFTERTMRMNVPKRGADTRASTPEGETKTMATTTVDNRRETVSLIGSDKVERTPVYGMDDRKIGTVQRVMLDKISGKVAYAVVSFGGFLGIGEDYFPMPWASLKYDAALGGYRVGITEDQLNNAPRFNRSTDWDWSDRARDRTV